MNVLVGLDGLTVGVDSPWWPEEDPAFVAGRPGSGIQTATCSGLRPTFGEVSLVAVPFGLAAPTEVAGLPASPGRAPDFLAGLAKARAKQAPLPQPAPGVTMFGQRTSGQANVVDLSVDAGAARRVVVAEWVAEAGMRIWILRISRAADGGQSDVSLQPFVDTLAAVVVSADAGDLEANPSTLALAPERVFDLRDADALPMASGFGGGVIAATTLSTPQWWKGTFDDDRYFPNAGTHSFALGANFSGLVACGPRPIAGGPDVVVQFFDGAHGQFEWECVELVMRWLHQAYSVDPYPGNGNQVIANVPATAGLEVIENGTVNRAPMPGDVVGMGATTPFGHTVVVTDSQVDPATGNGVVTVIEQNASSGGQDTYTVKKWQVMAPLSVIGWLHRPSNDGPTLTTMGATWNRFPFNPTFAIPAAWLAQLRAGSYAGRPISAEMPVPGAPAGATFQLFEGGLATFMPGKGASFSGAGLTDAQLGSVAQTPFLWGTAIPFIPPFGIPQAWLAQLRAGSYAGRPLSAEVPVPGAPAGTMFQVFERGLATFVPGKGASFSGAGLTDAQLRGVAQTAFLWGTNTPFVPEFAVPQAWLARLRAGTYPGRPLTGEVSNPTAGAGATFQVFENGLASFRPGRAVSWTG